jgi:4'-phosphopantetheinyl transferase
MMDGEMERLTEEIHVWRIQLPDNGQYPTGLAHALSVDEAARARRFIFDRDRARFIVSHATLRNILSSYTDQAPEGIAISIAEKGKPYLAHYPGVRFNLSHSGSWALLAVARGREIGVDIERIEAGRATGSIARRFFAEAEVRELEAMPEDRRLNAFFACWSRKEAYIKARGEGLGIPLGSFEVSLGDEAVLREAEDWDRWSLAALEAPEGYAAALVAEGAGWTVRYFTGSPSSPGT